MKRQIDKTPLYFLTGTVLLCLVFVIRNGIFGSEVDWISQHSVIPDYFRKLFYETGDLFPEFAMNLGGGQNIYNYSYYGLYNPVILISYFLPFLKMSDYIMISSMLCFAASVILFYIWMKKKGMEQTVSVQVSCIFALAAPLLYHSYRHIMFVDYMPFLLTALMGTDRYLEQRRTACLIFGIFLMIMTSFYFAVGGILVLCVYALSEYLKREQNLKIKGLLKCGGGYILCILTAIMMSSILLVPTVFSLGGSRNGNIAADVSWLLPAVKCDRFFYSPYGLGLSAFALTALISQLMYCICEMKRKQGNEPAPVNVLSARGEMVLLVILLGMLLIPAFGYLLNGGLYNKDKVFIPFLPVICYETGCYQKRLKEAHDTSDRLLWQLPYFITIALILLSVLSNESTVSFYAALADGIFMLALFLYSRKKFRKNSMITVSIIIMSVSSFLVNQVSGNAVSREFYNDIMSSSYDEALEFLAESDSNLYRTEVYGDADQNKADMNRIYGMNQYISSVYSSSFNSHYRDFRNHVFKLNEPYRNNMMQPSVNNPLFLKFMGVKYLISETGLTGYEACRDSDGVKMWKNEAAAPMAYVTDMLLSEQDYYGYSFPENQAVLLERAVIRNGLPKEAGENSGMDSKFRKSSIIIPEINNEEIKIRKINNGYEILAEHDIWVEAKLEEKGKYDLFALSFAVENQKPGQDIRISVYDQMNCLSAESHEYANHNYEFTYLVGIEPEETMIRIRFSKGNYILKNIESFTGLYSMIGNPALYRNPVLFDMEETKGDNMKGTVNADASGYLITSIPYDAGFTIKVDGTEREKVCVNGGFLGCYMEQGKHDILITYHARGVKAGRILSIAGLALYIIQQLISFIYRKTIKKY